jgi:hypothetical protein
MEADVRFLLFSFLCLLPVSVLASAFPPGHQGFVSWYCETADHIEAVALSKDAAAAELVLSLPGCYALQKEIPGVILEHIGTVFDPKINSLVEVYAVDTPRGIVYVLVPVEGAQT